MIEIGRRTIRFCSAWFLLLGTLCQADTEFTASLDREKIGLGQTVSLELSVKSDHSVSAGNPTFEAPGFDVVNEYTSTSVSSSYDSSQGGFRTQRTQQITRVLSPKKKGSLTISDIRVVVDGKNYTAPDLKVVVQEQPVSGGRRAGRGRMALPPFGVGMFGDDSEEEETQPSGPGTSPNQGPGQGITRGGGRDEEENSKKIFIRAEIEPGRSFYKGEQIIVSYYIYHQMRILNLQVDKFPVLNGFLREDLDLPVMGQRIGSENIALGSTVYERSLLARYAAYPLESGKLSIDPMSIKFTYYPKSQGLGQDDDFFMGFFRQMAPRNWAGKSDPIAIEVLPLPEAGRPTGFSGAVGQFQFSAYLDKPKLKVNEAVTVRVQVEGQGNFSSVKAAPTQWPAGVEVYDTKESVQLSKQGVGSKTIEYLLIPRQAGSFSLPHLRFSFFDPALKNYVEKDLTLGGLEVQDAAGKAPSVSQPLLISPVPTTPSKDAPQSYLSDRGHPGLKPLPADFSNPPTLSQQLLDSLPTVLFAFLTFFLVFLGWKEMGSFRSQASGRPSAKAKKSLRQIKWKEIEDVARQATEGIAWKDVSLAYDQLEGELFKTIDLAFELKSSALSREELAGVLADKGLSQENWRVLSQTFEACEAVKYSSSPLPQMEDHYRQNLKNLVVQARAVAASFS